ncbi:hypothetical protein A4X06_0g8319 [Tilletia controversa]|uniref:Uncharacterized protein n=1 Tax=Tilletia controversa TaxID=13291 RepID=A0A8X7STD3_9BASI|nr:hypothetical protein A4X06_0g8319 [Tilletia controversa]
MTDTHDADTRAAGNMAKLTSSNWSHWHPLLLLILRGRDLLDTIDPAAVPNEDEDAGPVNPLAVEMFRRCQDQTAYIIGFSCSPSMQAKVIKKHSPIEMLEVAKKECLSGSYANTARFLKQLIDLGSEPKEDMREHIGKFDTIFSNLNAVGYPLTEKAKVGVTQSRRSSGRAIHERAWRDCWSGRRVRIGSWGTVDSPRLPVDGIAVSCASHFRRWNHPDQKRKKARRFVLLRCSPRRW